MSWQIVPDALGPMLTQGTPERGTREQRGRMMAALRRMSRLDLAALEAAYAGDAAD